MATPKANYGIDAPTVVRNLVIAGAAAGVAGAVLYRLMVPAFPLEGRILSIAGFVSSFCLLATAGLMVWGSKYGKLREREKLIDTLGLSGKEKVLDVGCGRGLLLNGVARRLDEGKAFGVDLWRSVDQSGNTPEAAMENAKAEKVERRVGILTADMRDLPFPDASLDAVISSIAVHNVPGKEGRAQAIREIARVLKPKGRLVIRDLYATGEYVKTLRDLGWEDVNLSGRSFMAVAPIRIVTARKPGPVIVSQTAAP